MVLPWPSYLFLGFFLLTLALGLKGLFKVNDVKKKVLARHPMRRRRRALRDSI
ncbi:MAG: hypothetical protein VYD54_05915 [Bdellovibrionota bacterium]|nr:hypothetical protein [Bdellovibrionota bacterium]